MSDSLSTNADALGASAANRPALMGTRHMAVAGHYAAAHAAFVVLEAGGNATDAGVAAGIALEVLQPDIVSVAGVAPIMLYDAASAQITTISGLGWWPKAADPAYFRREHDGHIPDGLRRTVVPAAPDAWITALERFGTMSFGDVAAAAIRFARDGFPMYQLLADMIALHESDYARWSSSAAIYLPGGRPPRAGELFFQADLAATLGFMVEEERAHLAGGRAAGLAAARDAFYKGDIAATIAAFHRENGGWLTLADMNDFRVAIEPAVRTRFANWEVYTCGPWCQGPALIEALNLLDPAELTALGHNSIDYVHVVVEAIKLAFADRERWYGDPRFVEVPIERLISTEYATARRGLIRPGLAWPEMPPAGDPYSGAAGPGSSAEHLAGSRAASPAVARDTSYVCVVDRWGNAFSATPSDVSFDAPVIPRTGLSVSTRGSQSWTDPAHASCLAPGKRPRLTPNPAIAIRRGEVVMPFGTPGGDVQVQAMLQLFLNQVLFDMDPQVAAEAPRFASYSFPDSFEPHDYFPGRLQIEGRLDPKLGDALMGYGHKVEWWPAQTWRAGSVCSIRADRRSGLLVGGADPRRSSYAVGW
jgi:gamma-glutamyltranspeptidase / glutathione hydrolase